MDFKRKPTFLVFAAALSVSGAAFASGSTPTWEEALASSPNRLTAAEQADLERRAASGESALQAPEGTYSPSAAGRMSTYGGAVTNPPGSNMESSADGTSSAAGAVDAAPSGDALGTGGALGDARRAAPAVPATPADPGVTSATPATPAVPSDKADSRDDSIRNDVAPRDRKLPADRPQG